MKMYLTSVCLFLDLFLQLVNCDTVSTNVVKVMLETRNVSPVQERTLGKMRLLAKEYWANQNKAPFQRGELNKITSPEEGTADERDVEPSREITLAKIHLLTQEKVAKGLKANVKDEDEGIPNDKSEFRPLPFPVDFRFYDVNHNGGITLRELVEVTGPAENVQRAFESSDADGNGVVTMREYDTRPWGYSIGDVVLQD